MIKYTKSTIDLLLNYSCHNCHVVDNPIELLINGFQSFDVYEVEETLDAEGCKVYTYKRILSIEECVALGLQLLFKYITKIPTNLSIIEEEFFINEVSIRDSTITNQTKCFMSFKNYTKLINKSDDILIYLGGSYNTFVNKSLCKDLSCNCNYSDIISYAPLKQFFIGGYSNKVLLLGDNNEGVIDARDSIVIINGDNCNIKCSGANSIIILTGDNNTIVNIGYNCIYNQGELNVINSVYEQEIINTSPSITIVAESIVIKAKLGSKVIIPTKFTHTIKNSDCWFRIRAKSSVTQ